MMYSRRTTRTAGAGPAVEAGKEITTNQIRHATLSKIQRSDVCLICAAIIKTEFSSYLQPIIKFPSCQSLA